MFRKRGIFDQNKSKLVENEKDILRERKRNSKSKEGDPEMCDKCNGFFSKSYYSRHRQLCRSNFEVTPLPVSLHFLKNAPKDFYSYPESYRRNIVGTILNDEIGTLCKTDEMILLVGCRLYDKSKRKVDKIAEVQRYVRAEMRKLANLYSIFKQQNIPANKFGNGLDMLLRENYDILRECIEQMTGSGEKIKAGLKHSLYYAIRNAALIWKGNFLIKGQDNYSKEMDDFLTVLALLKEYVFGDASYHINRSRQVKLRKPDQLPVEEDVRKLRSSIMDSIERICNDPFCLMDQHSYVELRNAICVRLTLFNGRRGGEPARLLIEECNDAVNDKWIDKQRTELLDPLEQALIANLKIGYQGGKGNNHLVSVFIPNDCLKGLEMLCNTKVRSDIGIKNDNPYVFPSINDSERHVSGWHTVDAICKKLTLEKKSNLTATHNRHRVSTLFASEELPDNERELFFRHMGHSRDINEQIYQVPPAIREVTKIGKMLAAIDSGI